MRWGERTRESIWALKGEEENKTRYTRLRGMEEEVVDSKTGWLEVLQQPPLTPVSPTSTSPARIGQLESHCASPPDCSLRQK